MQLFSNGLGRGQLDKSTPDMVATIQVTNAMSQAVVCWKKSVIIMSERTWILETNRSLQLKLLRDTLAQLVRAFSTLQPWQVTLCQEQEASRMVEQ